MKSGTLRLGQVIGAVLLAVILFSFNSMLSAQETKKAKPKLRLNYSKIINQGVKVTANAYYKTDEGKHFCFGGKVNFYSDEDMEQLYSTSTVDEEGNAILSLRNEDLPLFEDSANHYHFYAQLEEGDDYKKASADLAVLNADIDVQFLSGDTSNILRITVMGCDENSCVMIPADKLPVKCFLVRSLGTLPIGGDFSYTDSLGITEVRCPDGLYGDEQGNLNFLVKVDESDVYGTVEFREKVPWGIPKGMLTSTERSIIGPSSNAPISLMVVVLGGIIAVWGTILYLITGLFRINKLGRQTY